MHIPIRKEFDQSPPPEKPRFKLPSNLIKHLNPSSSIDFDITPLERVGSIVICSKLIFEKLTYPNPKANAFSPT
jgi:hypothetical protein